MRQFVKVQFVVLLVLFSQLSPAHSSDEQCQKSLLALRSEAAIAWAKKKFISKSLDLLAIAKGLPKSLKQIKELERTGRFKEYDNFGEMGIAEMEISVRYNQARLDGLNTGRPLIIVANHHLGIADGLALHYLAGLSRKDTPSLLFLARWIEKLLSFAVYGDQDGWGTAVPVEINLPKKTDPNFEVKMAEVKAFNGGWSRTSIRVLKERGALIIFPAGHVAGIEPNSGEYPKNIFDSPGSWQDGFLSLARIGKADIVFANVDSVNSEAFYKNRKRFGGGDKERVIWFLSEAVAKKGKFIDVHFSNPMSLDEIYNVFAQKYGHSKEALKADSALITELMRQFTYEVSTELDAQDSPKKKGSQ